MAPPVAVALAKWDPSQFSKENTGYKTTSGAFTVSKVNQDGTVYRQFLPTWNPNDQFEPLTFFPHSDRGLNASSDLSNLFPPESADEYKVKSITPKFGLEIHGVQLSQLSDAGKDDLARLVAERGVVVFRGQDFAKYGPRFATKWGEYYGPLHVHPSSGTPEGFPQIHIVFRGATDTNNAFRNTVNNVAWHSDVSYELQPPGITLFSVLQGPESGGDTIFANCVEAYERLSPTFQGFLETLHVVHTSRDQAASNLKAGGVLRRAPVTNVHPLVRTHPVTKKKFLYVNREFSRKIVELKQEESTLLLEFLFNHLESAHDLQLRASWEKNTVVLWDNRSTIHSAINDWDTSSIRHAFRISPQAERPVLDLRDVNNETYLTEKYNGI